MTGLLILLAAIFTGCSCYYLSCAFADIPTVRTSKAMMTTRKQTGSWTLHTDVVLHLLWSL